MTYGSVCSITLLITCACFGRIICGDTDTNGCEKARVLGLDTVKELNLGYGNLENWTAESPDIVDSDELTTRLNSVYREVQCSYAYGALTHMRLTKILLDDGDLSVCIGRNVRFSFTQPAALMLDTVRKVPALCSIRDLMWLFLLYTQMAIKQLDYVTWENVWSQNRQAVLSAHEAVDRLLEEFTDTCVEFNKKNDPPTPAEDPEKSLWVLYEKNYQTIIGQVKNNRCKHFLTCEFAEIEQKYSPYQLSLNYIFDDEKYFITTNRLFGNFYDTEKPQEIINHLIELYEVGTKCRPNDALNVRIKSLGTFHNDFVQLLKIMAFRKVWGYMNSVSMVAKLHYSMTFYLFYNIDKPKKDMSDLLTEFAKYLALTEDPDVKTVLGRLNCPVPFFKCGSTDDEQAMTSAINNTISKLSISPLMKYMNLPEESERSTTKQLNDVKHLMDYGFKKNLITGNIESTKIFVNHLKKAFNNKIDFEVIHTFVQLKSSSVFQRFSDLEQLTSV